MLAARMGRPQSRRAPRPPTTASHRPGTLARVTDVPPAGPTSLLVIRHGQSEWNAVGRWQGRADVALDEAGRLQAAEAALALGTFDAIWSSDLQRAHLTASIIGEILGIGPVLVDPRLAETDVGPWQGLTQREVEEGWPGYLAARRRPLEARSIVLGRIASEKLISADYKHVDGTSFSAPIVSSIVAQMLEARPNLTPREVKQILCDTAVLLAGVPPEVQGHGLVAPDRALDATLSLVPEPKMML